MSGCTLQNSVGKDLVIHDHGAPAGRVSLRADDGNEVDLTALFQYLKPDLAVSPGLAVVFPTGPEQRC